MNEPARCPRGHLMKNGSCTVCPYHEPAPPPTEPVVIINWGGRGYTYANAGEALAAGFRLT